MKGVRSKRYVSPELHRTLKREIHFLVDLEKKQSEVRMFLLITERFYKKVWIE